MVRTFELWDPGASLGIRIEPERYFDCNGDVGKEGASSGIPNIGVESIM